jgi:hypothetical protein
VGFSGRNVARGFEGNLFPRGWGFDSFGIYLKFYADNLI